MIGMVLDEESCFRAVSTRDGRFDGWFVMGVRTTGIYCRPSCPAVTPKRRNVAFYRTAAAAQSHGLRACRRCLPDAVPGSPEWNLRADLAARAMRLIGDGVVERDGVSGLAGRLGYSERHLTRVLTTELGAGPLALARAHRAHAARLLVETTDLLLADVAFAAGFASVRQFNETLRAVFGVTPSVLRADARRRARTRAGLAAAVPPQPGTIALRLPVRAPMDGAGLLAQLVATAVPGVEYGAGAQYARTLALPHGPATVRLHLRPTTVDAVLRLADLRDLGVAVNRVRRLLDADADPAGSDAVLAADPALAVSVAATPGIRVPGTVDGAELVMRAVLRGPVPEGEPLTSPDGDLTHLFPTPAVLAETLTDPDARAVATALATGALQVHAGRDPAALTADLLAQPGIDAATADRLTTRLLGAPDVLPADDPTIRRGAAALGLPSTVDGLRTHARRWSPWGSYAAMHLRRAA